MSMSGSIMMLLYLSVTYGSGKRISAEWRYLMLKASILYYLIPLPFLKRIYMKAIELLSGRGEDIVRIYSKRSLIVSVGEEIYLNQPLQIQIWAIVGWMLVSVGLLAVQVGRYLQRRKRIMRTPGIQEETDSDDILRMLQRKYRVKRRVRCYTAFMENKAFTFGVLKPVIIYGTQGDAECWEKVENKELLLSHELVHIKRWDTLWKILQVFVCIIHFYNPLVWWLKKETEQVCELSCDALVIKDKGEKEKDCYMMLLIKGAGDTDKLAVPGLGISKNAKKIKERMDNIIYNRKKWGKRVSGCVVAAVVLLNSLTVFAYEDVQYWKVNEESANVEEYIHDLLNNDVAFVPGKIEDAQKYWGEPESDIILYDMQFVDKEGNIYPVDERIVTYATCNHQYVSGTTSIHTKYSNGSCTLTYYNAQRCNICGYTVRGEKIGSSSFLVCPH